MNNNNNYFFKITIKETLLLLLLFLLLYFEPIKIGDIKISQIWKAIVVILMLMQLTKYKLPMFFWVGLLFSFKYLIYSEFPYGISDNFRLFLESLVFPVALGYLYYYYSKRENIEYLIKLAILLSLFLIFSSAPFILGLKSLYPEYDLSQKYGLNLSATKGLFYHIASASKMFTVATIFIFIFKDKFSNTIFNKLLWLSAFLLGNYLIIMSWTRTAWFIYLAALLITVFYKSKFRVKFIGLICFIIAFVGISYVYETNDAFKWRMTGGASYREESELSFNQLAAARAPYISVAMDNMKDQGIFSTFLGYGELLGKDMFEKKTNMAITSHNGTFEIIESNGILGLSIYLFFCILLFKHIKTYWNFVEPLYKKTVLLMMFIFISFYITSHGTPLWGELIYSFIFVFVMIKGKRNKTLHNLEMKSFNNQ